MNMRKTFLIAAAVLALACSRCRAPRWRNPIWSMGR